MNKFSHRLFVITTILLLCACQSVPLTTMFKMASLDHKAIAAIAPKDIRVRLSITDPVELQTKHVRLALQFEHKDGSIPEYKYLLAILRATTEQSGGGWFSRSELKHVYEFKLNHLSQLEFNKFQKHFVAKGKPKRYKWTVYYHLKNRDGKEKDMKIDVELKLSNVDDYFFLLRNAPVSINNLSTG